MRGGGGGGGLGEKALVFQCQKEEFKRGIKIQCYEGTLGHCCKPVLCLLYNKMHVFLNIRCGPDI